MHLDPQMHQSHLLHESAALHFRLMAKYDPSGHAELLAAVHEVLAQTKPTIRCAVSNRHHRVA